VSDEEKSYCYNLDTREKWIPELRGASKSSKHVPVILVSWLQNIFFLSADAAAKSRGSACSRNGFFQVGLIFAGKARV
jgi:hypothetical protein